jgi:hypothetical protein
MGAAMQQLYRTEWAEQAWDESLAYIKTIVDTAHNPFLILDEHLRVLAANRLFYKLFRVNEKDPEPKYVNEIGNGVWNIHTLGALLTGILPRNIFFKGIEVSSEFPSIGRKIMLLNGRPIYKEGSTSAMFSPIILLTMEDSTQMTIITAELADYAARIKNKSKMNDRTQKLETEVEQLKKHVVSLKINSRKRL